MHTMSATLLLNEKLTVLPELAVRILSDLVGRSLHKRHVLTTTRDQEYNTFAEGDVCDEVERASDQWQALVQVDDVRAYACAEQVLAHPWTSKTHVVAVVTSSSVITKC